jgi:hypothetical protein
MKSLHTHLERQKMVRIGSVGGRLGRPFGGAGPSLPPEAAILRQTLGQQVPYQEAECFLTHAQRR